jgi:hypothetical protein
MRSIRFGYDNPRQVPGEHNPVEHIAQISPAPPLPPARNDALTPAASAIAAYEEGPRSRAARDLARRALRRLRSKASTPQAAQR